MVYHILTGIVSVLLGCLVGCYLQEKRVRRIRRRADKDSRIIDVQSAWLHIYQEGRNLADFFHRHHYQRIAVQGLGKLGRTLISDLRQEGIEVCYGIDRNTSLADELGFAVYTSNDNLPEVDAVVITAVADYNEIANNLYEKVDCPLIPFDGILNELIE